MASEAKSANFGELYAAHAKDVYRFSLYLSGDAALAQDLTSETFLRVWIAEQPVHLASVKSWLFVIARNLYRHELRHIRRKLPLNEAIASGASLAGSAEMREQLAQVCRSLAALPEVDRSAVLLRVEGVSYQEIAGLLQISVASAKVKVHRARLHLAKENPGGIGHEYLEKRHS
ncbi:putative RNA-polymerase sigma factor [Candidatus Sulfopaludibacter sp. SbA3]|nr:putative RNA-polymerase sigma factor [Candidatus Sulfopaludibacter sp. SbA3]